MLGNNTNTITLETWWSNGRFGFKLFSLFLVRLLFACRSVAKHILGRAPNVLKDNTANESDKTQRINTSNEAIWVRRVTVFKRQFRFKNIS